MKVFISWSGERSHVLADALHEWMPLVLHYVEPWLSQADIEAGQRWAEQVAKELETSNSGIICVTRENAENSRSCILARRDACRFVIRTDAWTAPTIGFPNWPAAFWRRSPA